MPRRYDLVVLGGGTAGLLASTTAARLGARVVLVDDGPQPGGDCLYTGCVPSKTLIASAGLAHSMRNAGALGLAATDPEPDFARVMERVSEVIAAAALNDAPERLNALGVETIRARGRFAEPGVVEAGDRRLHYRSAVLATGSSPAMPPLPGLCDARPLTNETVWDLRDQPRRLAILGGGPIGTELAQAFARLGSEVDLIGSAPQVLPREDPQAGAVVGEVLAEEGVTLHLGSRAERVAGDRVVLASGEEVPFERLLVALGRTEATDGIGLENVGVEVAGDGGVVTDSRLRTTGERIWAAGDVVGRLYFTHLAGLHGAVAALNALFGARQRIDHESVPWVTFTDPEVARVGETQAQAARRLGHDPVVLSYDYAHSDRALTAGRARGFAKLVADRRGRLLGATVVAHAAGESLAGLARMVAEGGKVSGLATAIHPYPTFSEGPARAAADWWFEHRLTPRRRRLSGAALAVLRSAHGLRMRLR